MLTQMLTLGHFLQTSWAVTSRRYVRLNFPNVLEREADHTHQIGCIVFSETRHLRSWILKFYKEIFISRGGQTFDKSSIERINKNIPRAYKRNNIPRAYKRNNIPRAYPMWQIHQLVRQRLSIFRVLNETESIKIQSFGIQNFVKNNL